MAKIDVEHCKIAAALRDQRDRLGNGCRRTDNSEPGIGDLLGDIERNQDLILDQKYSCGHMSSLSTRISALSYTLVSGHASRHISPAGAKSRSTSPSRLNSAMLLMTFEPNP